MEKLTTVLLLIIFISVLSVLVLFFLYYLYQKNNQKLKFKLYSSIKKENNREFFKVIYFIDFLALRENNIFKPEELERAIIEKFKDDLRDYESFYYLYNKIVRISGRRGRRLFSLLVKAAGEKDLDFWPKLYLQSIVGKNIGRMYLERIIEKLPENYREIVYEKCLERIGFYLRQSHELNANKLKKILEIDRSVFQIKLEEIQKN